MSIETLKAKVLGMIPVGMQDLRDSNQKRLQATTPVAWHAPSNEEIYYHLFSNLIKPLKDERELPQLLVNVLALNKEFLSKDANFNKVKSELLMEVSQALVESHTVAEMSVFLVPRRTGAAGESEFLGLIRELCKQRRMKVQDAASQAPSHDAASQAPSHDAAADIAITKKTLITLEEQSALAPKLSFTAFEHGFAKRYPHSYFGFIGKTPLETAINLLTDYTKGDSRFKRVAFFHWNRHHVGLVSQVVKAVPSQGDENQRLQDLLAGFKSVIMKTNPNGSLRRRLDFIAAQAGYKSYGKYCEATRPQLQQPRAI